MSVTVYERSMIGQQLERTSRSNGYILEQSYFVKSGSYDFLEFFGEV